MGPKQSSFPWEISSVRACHYNIFSMLRRCSFRKLPSLCSSRGRRNGCSITSVGRMHCVPCRFTQVDLTLRFLQRRAESYRLKTAHFQDNFKFATAVDLNKCLKQIISLFTCAPISELPSYTMIGTNTFGTALMKMWSLILAKICCRVSNSGFGQKARSGALYLEQREFFKMKLI